jgi:peptide-methionine (S)-S-oxide reductase
MNSFEKATVGGGCFWCVEAAFQPVSGVEEVVSGYSGGTIEDPSYEEVCSGTTDHAEVVQVTYDPSEVTYEDLLTVFFTVHDPTQLNRQGPDVGPQYRSIILYHDENQKQTAEMMVDRLDSSGQYDEAIVTEIVPFDTFYPAEDYHQNYFKKNPNQAYCRRMIPPKLRKLNDEHQNLLAE